MASFAYESVQLCGLPGCNRRCYESNGIVHGYCGRTHAAEALEAGLLQSLQSPHGHCHRCRLKGCSKEVFYDEDTGRVHDYCCMRHAMLAQERGEYELAKTMSSKTCALPGCIRPVWKDPNTGHDKDFCGKTHALQAAETKKTLGQCARAGCENTAWVDAQTGRPLLHCSSRCADQDGMLIGKAKCSLPGCNKPVLIHHITRTPLGYCSEDHRLRATQRNLEPVEEAHVDRVFGGGMGSFQLALLMKTHPDHKAIKKQFLDAWKKPGEPSVARIFKIKVPDDIYRAYKAYSATCHAESLKRRFHGTGCSPDCDFYVNLKGAPCSNNNMCNSCSICTHGFDLRRSGATPARTAFQLRYGPGLYFSSTSGKANDYAELSEKVERGRRFRVMFVCNVAVGKAFTTQEGFLGPPFPPTGYDAVIGEVGKDLNFDEVVVYRNDAACPAYMIIYSMPLAP